MKYLLFVFLSCFNFGSPLLRSRRSVAGTANDTASNEIPAAAPATPTAAPTTPTAAPTTLTTAPPITHTTPTTPMEWTSTAQVNECPGDWVDYGDMGCYKFIHESTSGSWLESVGLCEQIGGYLAEPKTAQHAEFLASSAMLAADFSGIRHWYIGLTDFGHEGSWIWQWSDEPLSVFFWGKGSPETGPGNLADCGVLVVEGGEFWWKDTDCLDPSQLNAIVAPICQFDPNSKVTTPQDTTTDSQGTTTPHDTTTTSYQSPTACKTGWTAFQDRCYWFKNYLESSWVVAEEYCKGQDAHLASVHSSEEDAFIQNLAGGESFWLGGEPDGTAWKWSDETPMDYTNYYYGDHQPGECLFQELDLYENGWSTSYCGYKTSFVCKQ